MNELACTFSAVDPAKSQAIYKTFVNGRVITKQTYVLHRHQFEGDPLYTELFKNLSHFEMLYRHIGFVLNYNVDGEFFYISQSDTEEEADVNATKVQAILLIIARYWVDKGRDLDDLTNSVVGLGRADIDTINEQIEYNEIRMAVDIDSWPKAMEYLTTRNFVYKCGDQHYVLSSAGQYFLKFHVDSYLD